jgi:hypothetical protein
MSWWFFYLGTAQHKWLGCCLVEANDYEQALDKALKLSTERVGNTCSLEVAVDELPPKSFRNRLLSEDDIEMIENKLPQNILREIP